MGRCSRYFSAGIRTSCHPGSLGNNRTNQCTRTHGHQLQLYQSPIATWLGRSEVPQATGFYACNWSGFALRPSHHPNLPCPTGHGSRYQFYASSAPRPGAYLFYDVNVCHRRASDLRNLGPGPHSLAGQLCSSRLVDQRRSSVAMGSDNIIPHQLYTGHCQSSCSGGSTRLNTLVRLGPFLQHRPYVLRANSSAPDSSH